MKVTLISHTQDAETLLLFTKSTRLNMTPNLMQELRSMSEEEKLEQLEYMANTIPSSWEFVDYVFLVEGVSRAYTHQQVRTRAASYAQQTMRVLDMGDFDYVYPEKILANPEAKSETDTALEGIKSAYRKMVNDLDIAPEDARGVLPTNIATNIVCKFNLRTFVDLAKARTGGRTQREYQRVLNAMVDEVLRVHPWAEKFLFQDGRDYFAEIEKFAEEEYGGDLLKKGKLLKIVDKMRKGK
ncbi:MAG: FAD-dependent thymidylate synthase [Marivivens sp.]|nr:FAD-dependent thymidylate synthase [Marivivens sp.]NBT49966.1 FAD-dependent thymidylate synthase [Marivivens sp.]NCW67186.1 FAD-dependent thymidylate synthase [Marivivens sp.]